jgi:4-amino-4-deoxy-L-arabinose transferase-like glycosyltransferase
MLALGKHKLLVGLAVAAVLAVHAGLALWAVARKSVTADEVLHLTGGYTYWHFADYRLHPENGILPQRWAAIPAVLAQPPFPPLAGNPYWRTSEVQVIGHQFFYETGHDHFPMLMAARAMIAVFSVATGLLVFLWSRRLFGLAGGFVSLGLFAFCPTFLAHGVLATSDMCMTFFFLASCGAWWRHLHHAGARPWLLSAMVFGLACVAKHSAALLVPMMIAMALVRAWQRDPLSLFGGTFRSRPGKVGIAALSALGHGAVAAFVIWAFYGFSYGAFNPDLPPAAHFVRPWEVLDLHIGGIGRFIRLLASWHALPEAFLYGSAYVVETAQVRSAFLNGEYSATGWISFFPWTFVFKTTLPVLAATLLVGGLAFVRWRRMPATARSALYAVTPLVVLFGVYWAFSLASHLNIGHRHILPTYPVLFIAAGALGAWWARRAGRVVIGVLLAGQVATAAAIAPHFLAYFNPIAGGPENGYRHLVDSSLDWGQDLPELKKWLDAHAGGAPVFLSYFGLGEPAYYDIHAQRLPFVNGFKIPQPYVHLEAGIYAISATSLSHVYSAIRGPWTMALENEYQELRALEPLFAAYTQDPQRRIELEKDVSAAQWRKGITRHDQLRFARLCYYLRLRRPEAQLGYSIHVYRLSAEEVAAATARSITDWSRLIEQTMQQRAPAAGTASR